MAIGSHQSPRMINDEWLTPPELLKALGPFDLDPCAPVRRPWDMAKHHYTIDDLGLMKPWPDGYRVFCNPPYGPQTGKWLAKMVDHGNGIALIFARTETEMFFSHKFAARGLPPSGGRGIAATFLYLRFCLHYVSA